jgi:hypothetical protein
VFELLHYIQGILINSSTLKEQYDPFLLHNLKSLLRFVFITSYSRGFFSIDYSHKRKVIDIGSIFYNIFNAITRECFQVKFDMRNKNVDKLKKDHALLRDKSIKFKNEHLIALRRFE